LSSELLVGCSDGQQRNSNEKGENVTYVTNGKVKTIRKAVVIVNE
jgi:hypothetical protein